MITPYLPTLNLSVDNALSTQQIIHQLITQMNTMTKYLNDLDDELDVRIAKQLQRQLDEFKIIIDAEIEKALEEGKQYTDIKISDVNQHFLEVESEIIRLQNRVLALETELPETEQKLIKMINNAVKRLENKMERMLKESVATTSPLDGTTKSVSDSIYDLNTVVARANGICIGDIIRGSLADGSVTNPPPGYYAPTRQTINDLLTYNNKYSSYAFQSESDVAYVRNIIYTLTDNSITNWCYNSFYSYCVSTRIGADSSGNEIAENNGTLLNSIFAGSYGSGNVATKGTYIGKFDMYDDNYLMFARDVGFLDSNNEPMESGIYPL